MTKPQNPVQNIVDKLREVSALQAQLITLIYREGMPLAHVCATLKLSMDRIRAEEAAGIKNMFNIATKNGLVHWLDTSTSTPRAGKVSPIRKAAPDAPALADPSEPAAAGPSQL